MPELAEVKLMADFVNKANSLVKEFKHVAVNPKTKVKTDLSCLERKDFIMRSQTRGKELRITFYDKEENIIAPEGKNSLYFAMGMSGNFSFMANNGDLLETVKTASDIKHIKISFISEQGLLVMHDMRNFGKWRWDSNWKDSRGPCPFHEHKDFRSHVYELLNHPRKKKLSIKPLNEILMDQSYFNGIGNYLRSTILNRLDVNPFQTFANLSEEKQEELLTLCHDIPSMAYAAGGGEFYTFKNPAVAQIKKEYKMIDILDCYGRKDLDNVTFIDDKSRRRFWFDKKWYHVDLTQKYLKSLKK